MGQKTDAHHGKDHLPGGADPIPGLGTRQVNLPLDAPDANANAFIAWSPNYGTTNLRALVMAFATTYDGTWEGRIRIPADYSSGGTIALSFMANATSGALRCRVSSSVVAEGATVNAPYTDEAYVNTTVPGTALQRFTVSFVLSTTLAAGATLAYKITRNGASGSDTLAVDVLLWHAILTYTSG